MHTTRCLSSTRMACLFLALGTAGLPAAAQTTAPAAAPPRSAAASAQAEAKLLLADEAARLAAQKLAEPAASDLDELRQEALAEIQQNLTANRQTAASRERVRALIETRLQRRLDAQLAQTAATMLAGQNMSAEQFRQQLGAGFETLVSGQKQRFVSGNLAGIFSDARQKAVAAQIGLLQHAVFPDQRAVDEADRAGWSQAAQQALAKGVRERVGANIPTMLEETETQTAQIAEQIMQDVTAQRDQQLAGLTRAVPISLVTRGQIERALRQSVDNELQRARSGATAGHPVYDLLPSVREKVSSQAADEETSRWDSFLHGYTVVITQQQAVAQINTDLPRYHDPAASETLFMQDMVVAAANDVVKLYGTKAADAPDRTEFLGRLQVSIATSGDKRATLEHRIVTTLQTVLPAAREEIASQQFANRFAPLASGAWQPDEESIAQGKLKPADLSDFSKASALPGIRGPGPAGNDRELLAETEQKVSAGVRRLVIEAQTALTQQRGLVTSSTPAVRQEMQKTTDRGPGVKPMLIGRLTTLVTRAWATERPSLWRTISPTPAVAATKYAELFKTTRADIEKTVDNLLSEPVVVVPTEQPKPEAPSRAAPTKGDATGIWWVWIVAALLLVALLVALLVWWARRSDDEPRPRRPRPRKPAEGDGDGTPGEGGPGNGQGGDPAGAKPFPPTIPFRGLVIEVRDLPRVVSTIGATTDMRPAKQQTEFALYEVGPMPIFFVQEGHLPATQQPDPPVVHIERLHKRLAGPGS